MGSSKSRLTLGLISRLVVLTSAALAVAGDANSQAMPFREAKRVAIVIPAGASKGEEIIGATLKKRIERRSKVQAEVRRHSEPVSQGDLDLQIVVRRAAPAPRVQLPPTAVPTLEDGPLPPEAFYVHTESGRGPLTLFAEGADLRGELYAAGEVLRHFTYLPDRIQFQEFSIRSAPAFRWRGSSSNQGGTMIQITGARGWTEDELHDCVLDYALAGANTFYAGGSLFTFCKELDLMTEYGCRPNELPGHPEWRKRQTERGQFVCPSIPEAHAALLAYWEERFKKADNGDVLRFFAGDPAGCRCEQCQPWGKTFVHLCAELAPLWKKYHPHSEVQICNQDVDNEGDLAIFGYLNTQPHAWLNSMSYGPGSNAMSPYFRKELRRDLFVYPGQGPVNRYLAYTLQNLPQDVSICHYSDITHWISSQYQVENPEPHMREVYGRRTFHQRPAAMYRIFQRISPFSEGDIIYSEGHHDELHQYLWNRMLWNPNRSLDDLLSEYATYHFGKEAASEMIQASLQLEKNLEAPIETNDGIERYYNLVKDAGTKIPANLMAIDYRWHEHMQKAALDRCLRIKVRLQDEAHDQANALLKRGLESHSLRNAVDQARRLLARAGDTAETTRLMAEANRVGQESDRIFGVRNTGYFGMDGDFVGLTWAKGQVSAMASVSDDNRLRRLVNAFVNYEDPGPGGFYDDAGSPDRQPHLTQGSVRNPAFSSRRASLDRRNRPSANTYVFSRSGPIVFTYTGLDPPARYKIKVTLVTPRPNARQFGGGGFGGANAANVLNRRQTENILANDVMVAKDVAIPTFTARQFQFDLPDEAARSGRIEIKFLHPESDDGRAMAVVSEIWLMKR